MSLIILNPLPIRFHCYKVLPLVYDESLSYYEQLCKILYRLNESITAINDLNTAVSDISGNITQLTTKVNDMQTDITNFENRVNNTLVTINKTMAEYDARFNEYDTRFDNLEQELTKEIQNNVKALKDYIDETLGDIDKQVTQIIEKELQVIYNNLDNMEQELKDEIKFEIKKLIASIPDLTTIEVTNPVTGKLSKVQVALDDLFMNTRYNALTIDEFNHLHLSVDECNKLMYRSAFRGWSVITWLTEAKELFDKSLKHRMANAVTGVWQDFKKNIEENTDMLRICGCLTVEEFGALNMTVDGFNNVGATCYELAWRSNRIFV